MLQNALDIEINENGLDFATNDPQGKPDFMQNVKSKLVAQHRKSIENVSRVSVTRNNDITHSNFQNETKIDLAQPRTYMDELESLDGIVRGQNHARAGSIYTISRESLTSRLAHLTSIPLPTVDALSARITLQPDTRQAAAALTEVGNQICRWTREAGDILNDLRPEDDVEWASAGGHDGMQEIEQAVKQFSELVKVYLAAIDGLQEREDVGILSEEVLTGHVLQMEKVVNEWKVIEQNLKDIKEQVEIALEWHNLWNTTLGQIGMELDKMANMIYTIEEKRHSSSSRHEIQDLHNIGHMINLNAGHEDAQMSELSAQMQSLRTSLDFLPMHLSSFWNKGAKIYPTGCNELEERHSSLEEQWKKLENNVIALRTELDEDKWVSTFKTAGGRAKDLMKGVENCHDHLKTGLDSRLYKSEPGAFLELEDAFRSANTTNISAIEQIINQIDQNMVERRSVNGEILKLQSDLHSRFAELHNSVFKLRQSVDSVSNTVDSQQLRDSLSTVTSSELYRAESERDTPRSSPASSIVNVKERASGTTEYVADGHVTSNLQRTRDGPNFQPSTPSARPSVVDSRRYVSSPSLQRSEPYQDKSRESKSFRDFRDPIGKPRFNASGKSLANPAQVQASPRRYTPSAASRGLLTPVRSREISPTREIGMTPTPRRQSGMTRIAMRSVSAMTIRSNYNSSGTSFSTPKATSLLPKGPETLFSNEDAESATNDVLTAIPVLKSRRSFVPTTMPRPGSRSSLSGHLANNHDIESPVRPYTNRAASSMTPSKPQINGIGIRPSSAMSMTSRTTGIAPEKPKWRM